MSTLGDIEAGYVVQSVVKHVQHALIFGPNGYMTKTFVIPVNWRYYPRGEPSYQLSVGSDCDIITVDMIGRAYLEDLIARYLAAEGFDVVIDDTAITVAWSTIHDVTD